MTHRVNTKRKFGEAGCYIHVVIDGKDALLTEDQAELAIERAKKQPEDVPTRALAVRAWRAVARVLSR